MLTTKQQAILKYIRSRITEDRLPPTIREIAAHFGFSSTGTVRDYLRILARKGHLVLEGQKARAMALARGCIGIPVVGNVCAGKPQFAEQDIQGYVDMAGFLPRTDEVFALRVSGDSMIGAGIMEGDTVIVRRQPRAAHGDIVVATVDAAEATVKYFKKIGARWYLVAANKKYRPILCKESTGVIGKVIAVLRRYV